MRLRGFRRGVGASINDRFNEGGSGGVWTMPAQALAATGGILIPGTGAWSSAAQQLAATGGILIPGTAAWASAAQQLAATGGVGITNGICYFDSRYGISQSGGSVNSWTSLIGTAAPSNTSTARPTYNATDSDYNGLPSLGFNGSQWLAQTYGSALSQPITHIIVARITNETAEQFLVGTNNNRCDALLLAGGTPSLYAGSQFNGSGGNISTTVPHVFAFVFNGASPASKIYIDSSTVGVTSGSSGSNQWLPVCLGALGAGTDPMTGTMAAEISINAALSAAQIGVWFSALGTLYNHAWS